MRIEGNKIRRLSMRVKSVYEFVALRETTEQNKRHASNQKEACWISSWFRYLSFSIPWLPNDAWFEWFLLSGYLMSHPCLSDICIIIHEIEISPSDLLTPHLMSRKGGEIGCFLSSSYHQLEAFVSSSHPFSLTPASITSHTHTHTSVRFLNFLIPVTSS